MTLDELRLEVKADFATVGEKIDELSTSVATIGATVEAGIDRHATEIGVLFTQRSEHERRISAVERDYTPKQQTVALEERVRGVEKDRWIGVGIIAAINFVGIGGIAALVAWGAK